MAEHLHTKILPLSLLQLYYNGAETQEVDLSDSGWDYQRSLETVALLSKIS